MPPKRKQLATGRIPKAPKPVKSIRPKALKKPADTKRARPAPKGIKNKPGKPIVHRPVKKRKKPIIKTDWGADEEAMAWALWKQRKDNKKRQFITKYCNVVHRGTQVNYEGTLLNSTSCVSHQAGI